MVRIALRKLFRDMRRHRAQFIAIVVTVALGVTLFGASYDAYQNLTASYDRVFAEVAFADLWISGGDADAIVGSVAERPDVEAVATRSVADVPLRVGEDGHQLLGRIVGMPPGAQPPVNQVLVLEGQYLDPAQPQGVLIEQHAADHFDIEPGDEVQVLAASGWQTLRVRGVAASAEYLWPTRSRQDPLTPADQFAVLFVPQPLVQELAPTQAVPQALVRFEPGTDVDAAAEDVAAATSVRGAADWYTREEQPSNAVLGEDIRGFGELSVMFPLLFISSAMMGTYLLLSRLVRSQRAQIGTLRAVGFGRRTLLLHYLGFGLVPAAVAGVLGAILGALLARAVTDVYTDVIALPIRVHVLHPGTAGLGFLIAVAAGTLAAIPAAWASMRIAPAEAMRGGRPAGRGGMSLVERFLPVLRRLPVRWRATLRNIGRQRRRTAYTAAAVALALVLVLVSWGMIDTVDILLNRQFEEIQRWDATLRLDQPVTPDALAELESVEGVAAGEQVATVGVALSTERGSYSTQLVAYEPGTTMQVFRPPGGGSRPLPEQGILVGVALRGLLGARPGAPITITIPSTGATAETTVAGFVDEPLGTFAYWSLPALRDAFQPEALPEGALSTVRLRFEPGVDRERLIETLAARPDVVVAADARSLVETARSLMGFFYAFVGVMLAFGGLMAGALVFNTASASIAERSGEMASLRASGMGGSTLARLLGVEHLLVAAIGVPFGLVAGYFVARVFMGSFSSDLFQFNLEMRASTLVLAAVGVLLFAALSELPALRAAQRIDIAGALRQPGL